MKHLMIEFLGTFSIAFCMFLCNISAFKEEPFDILGTSIVYGMLIMIFSQISRGYSKGFFNPYFSIFEILSGKLSIERGIGKIISY